jgi:rfaE bifunctional protein nucleotidyltransferase chain/domain
MRGGGLKLVLVHGTFDLLHYGHLRMFEAAKRLGSMLVVTLTADVYVNKGWGRPVFSQTERAFCIAKNKDVDKVEVCFDRTALPMIEKYQPDIYVKGEDYKTEDKHGNLAAERKAVESYGGKVVLMENLPRYSSTDLIERVREAGRRG